MLVEYQLALLQLDMFALSLRAFRVLLNEKKAIDHHRRSG